MTLLGVSRKNSVECSKKALSLIQPICKQTEKVIKIAGL